MNEIEQIRLDALRALSGANEVRERLLAGLAMGTPSVVSSTYLTKCRVKEHHKIVEKVLDRRTKNPSYTASHLTDIVGLRLLSLYRKELPLILDRFLSFVFFAQQDPFALFSGPKLIDTLHEVIIYRTSDDTDTALQHVISVFRNLKLSVEIVPDGKDPNDVEADVKIVKKPSEYSSIHLVLWCNGLIRDKQFPVPLEVQIRTALEDVWAEIDHMLKYKVRDRDPETLPLHQKKEHDLAIKHLESLKRRLDNCSDTADLIETQIKHAFDIESRDTIPDTTLSVYTSKLTNLALASPLQSRINNAVQLEHELFGKLLDLTETDTIPPLVNMIRQFSSIAKTFRECLDKYEEKASEDPEKRRDARYYLLMEAALCLYWEGRLMKTASLQGENPEENDYAGKSDLVLDSALRLYFNIEDDNRYSNDPILAFRVANVLAARGDQELALRKFEDAVVKLEGAELLPENHYLRVRIPKQLGVALWEEGEQIRRKGLEYRIPTFMLEKRRECYTRAFEVTKSVYGNVVEPVVDNPGTTTERENKHTANNLLDYTLSYWRTDPDDADREAFRDQVGMSKGWTKEFVTEVIGDGVETIEFPTLADTVREAGRYLGDNKMEIKAAERVLQLLETKDWTVHSSKETINEMRTDAEASLKRLRAKKRHKKRRR